MIGAEIVISGVRVGQQMPGDHQDGAADGVSARSAVDVSVTAAPYETILESIEWGTRADFRRAQGILVLHCWR